MQESCKTNMFMKHHALSTSEYRTSHANSVPCLPRSTFAGRTMTNAKKCIFSPA